MIAAETEVEQLCVQHFAVAEDICHVASEHPLG